MHLNTSVPAGGGRWLFLILSRRRAPSLSQRGSKKASQEASVSQSVAAAPVSPSIAVLNRPQAAKRFHSDGWRRRRRPATSQAAVLFQLAKMNAVSKSLGEQLALLLLCVALRPFYLTRSASWERLGRTGGLFAFSPSDTWTRGKEWNGSKPAAAGNRRSHSIHLSDVCLSSEGSRSLFSEEP